ncbi:MAG: type I-C CRISPR-associated protein Cas7/Csd2 [Myxococcales bacterium]|nr:type I-C CRISPR-associated protein Cas7/Csd2 [Polyangiaceae bacterium]MDW8251379.1 type I-C CRISPR-associated protein Cas7/Csd2 [Myxococcales bacterium]
MNPIKNRIDFVLLFDVQDGNPNGDPDAGNLPRVDAETGHGLVTDVCLKRHLRNYVTLTRQGQSGFDIYVKDRGVLNAEHEKAYKALGLNMAEESVRELPADLAAKIEEDFSVEGFSVREGDDDKKLLVYSGDLDKDQQKEAKKALKEIDKRLEDLAAELIKGSKSRGPKREKVESARTWMCKTYFDVRTFGAVMSTGVNCGQVRGPVQMTFARSLDPIFPVEHAITRVAVTKKEDQEKKATEMGRKSTVRYGLYRAYGFISPALARQTGFSEQDLSLLLEALGKMFEYARSSSKGLMSTRALILFEHENELGSAPSHELFEKILTVKRVGQGPVVGFQDYEITVNGHKIVQQYTRWLVKRTPNEDGYTVEPAPFRAAPAAS